MAVLQVALVVAVLCATVFADGEGPSEFVASTAPLDDGFVNVTLSWKDGSCVTDDTEFTLSVAGTNMNLTTRDSSISIPYLEYWTNYTFSLTASEPCPKELLNTTAHTGPGYPHKVKNFTVIPDGEYLHILVQEAFMPRPVDFYRISLNTSSSSDDSMVFNLERNASNINGEIWNSTLPGQLTSDIDYSAVIAPVIKDGEKLWTGAGSRIDFRSPRTYFPSPKNLRVRVDVKNARPGEKVRADVEWEYEGSDYAFFKVSWGLVDRYPQVVSTAIKHLTIDNLEYNASYTVQVDAYFKIDGKDIPKTNVSTSFDAVGVLLPPHDVQITHLNYSRVLLSWKAESPPDSDIKTSDLKFTVEYQAKDQPAKSIVVNNATAELKDLERSTNYTVRITTTYDNWRSASLQSYSFKTRDEDWPAAVTQNATVISKGTEDKAMYDFSWDLPDVDVPYQFQVKICAPDCQTIDVSFQEKHLQYPLNYFTDYNLTVTTVYFLPSNQTVMRLSNVHKGKSTVGVPDAVNFKSVSQKLNKLELTWDPPELTRGPVSFYEVSAWDPFDVELKNTGQFNATEGEIDLPRLTNSSYMLTLTAVAKDSTTGQEFRSPVEKEEMRNLELLAPPKDVKTVGRTQDSIQIEVIPSSEWKGIVYNVRWHQGTNSTNFMGETGSLTNLSPYEKVSFDVSSCFIDGATNLRCGNSLTRESRSNVGSPLEVGNFTARDLDNDTISLTWERPQVANGPIQGYVIEISEPSSPNATLRTFKALSADLAFDINGTATDTVYNVTIAAYNEDLVTSEPVFGAVTSILVHTRETSGWVIALIVLVVLVIVSLVVGGLYIYRKRMRASGSPIMSFSFLNDRNNNQNHPDVLVNE